MSWVTSRPILCTSHKYNQRPHLPAPRSPAPGQSAWPRPFTITTLPRGTTEQGWAQPEATCPEPGRPPALLPYLFPQVVWVTHELQRLNQDRRGRS